MVPVLEDGRILMIRQYRPAVDRETLELPAGARDRDAATGEMEDPALTAARELREETGYMSDSITHLISLRTAVAYCSEFTEVYLAEHLRPVGDQILDEAEEIRIVPCPLEDLLDRIYQGKIQDAKTVAGIMAYHSRLCLRNKKLDR